MSNSIQWPDPNATYSEIRAFYESNQWHPTEPGDEIQHEAPEVENGPSIVCNACGVVRVALDTPFCKSCMEQLAAAGVST